MAGTPTPNYQIPTYADTDAPNLAGAYNQAMGKIDTQMKANATAASAASAAASAADTKATAATTTANTAKTTADTAKTTADTAKTTADTAKTAAASAQSDATDALTQIAALSDAIGTLAKSKNYTVADLAASGITAKGIVIKPATTGA